MRAWTTERSARRVGLKPDPQAAHAMARFALGGLRPDEPSIADTAQLLWVGLQPDAFDPIRPFAFDPTTRSSA
jgi:hypothetical protein